MSTFMNFQGVDVVLVPLDDLSVDHGGRLDRDEVGQRILGQDETARVLAEMAGKPDELAGEV